MAPLTGSGSSPAFAAIDVGAETGRVLVGQLRDGSVELAEVHRFPNRPVRLPDGLRWDLTHLFAESLLGLKAARSRLPNLAGIAIDTWGVDYALLDDRGRLLGIPFHYRDARTEGMEERAYSRVSAERLYNTTGIQAMPINTVFQLLAEEGSTALGTANRLALVPDLLSYWLCGELANERTVASTSGLLDARTGEWAHDLIRDLGIPERIFGPLIEPGTVLGPALDHHGLGAVDAIATASHDTAAAFVAAPIQESGAAILSSGTWSLLGLELPAAVLSTPAREANLTNERGVEGTTRLLKNVMGLWLVQECRRAWMAQGKDLTYEDLMRLAGEPDQIEDVPLFDPDDEALLTPGDMPGRIATLCGETGQSPAGEVGDVVKAVLVSLACKYRLVLEWLEYVSGQAIESVHAIGGGARNQLLCRMTAEIVGRTVSAGPFEASALGNVLLQARATGRLASLEEMRVVAAASTEPLLYEPPPDRNRGDRVYERFLCVTGLTPAPFSIYQGT
jgi:rhamnulokinase